MALPKDPVGNVVFNTPPLSSSLFSFLSLFHNYISFVPQHVAAFIWISLPFLQPTWWGPLCFFIKLLHCLFENNFAIGSKIMAFFGLFFLKKTLANSYADLQFWIYLYSRCPHNECWWRGVIGCTVGRAGQMKNLLGIPSPCKIYAGENCCKICKWRSTSYTSEVSEVHQQQNEYPKVEWCECWGNVLLLVYKCLIKDHLQKKPPLFLNNSVFIC